ncbi:carboxyl transferase domain-containing protein [Nocardia sp. FBN12]|uniref:carboxyl transferase domain-containing protein n=1 Tax=Nocardia sp. FBN12 TaxID=3419766 RepID=UPI003CFCC9A9
MSSPAGERSPAGRTDRLAIVADRAPVLALLAGLVDPGGFRPWPDRLVDVGPDAGYARQLGAARARTGLDEAVVVGEARLGGRRIAVLAGEFGFLGGSIGVAAAHRLVTAIERATSKGLPLLALPCSGGTRMQEGTVAFVQMVKIAAAVADHKRAGLPYLVYLRHPTTGGVFASWASMGHLTLAEPGALVGFLGPRVYAALGAPLPEGVQRSENLLAHGLVDAVVSPEALGGWLSRALAVLDRVGEPGIGHQAGIPDVAEAGPGTLDLGGQPDDGAAHAGADRGGETTTEVSALPPRAIPGAGSPTDPWESVLRTRLPDRVAAADLLALWPDHVSLHGSAEGDAAPGVLAAIARIGGAPCVFLGHSRQPGPGAAATLTDGALRTARRAIRLAAELSLPVVTVIDTGGAELSTAAEEQGIAGQIARCLADLITLETTTVSILLGQGTGGAALAWLPADRVIATQHAWLSPLPPEGASAVVHHDVDHAAQLAREQGIHANALSRNGIVDEIISEHGDPTQVCLRVGAAVEHALRALATTNPADRYTRRRHRYRELGVSA